MKFAFCLGSDHLRGTAAQAVVMIGQLSHMTPLQKPFYMSSSKSLRRNCSDLLSAWLQQIFLQAEFIQNLGNFLLCCSKTFVPVRRAVGFVFFFFKKNNSI